MVDALYQGNVLKVESIKYPMLIASKKTFNDVSEQVIACPVVDNSVENALHIRINTDKISGIVLCEQLKLLDLSVRGYSIIDSLPVSIIMDITDAIQSIFDYV